MSKEANVHPQHDNIDALLPWYVTARLDDADAARVAASLAGDPGRLQRLERVREEHDESILGNEAIRVRSAYHADRLLAEVTRREAPLRSALSRLRQYITAALAMPPPGAIRWAAAAAAILIVVQAGALATLAGRQAVSYVPASGSMVTVEPGALALVAFVREASTAAVAELLAAHAMAIVHGPDGSGAFTVRLGPRTMSDVARREKIAALQQRSDVVDLVIPLR